MIWREKTWLSTMTKKEGEMWRWGAGGRGIDGELSYNLAKDAVLAVFHWLKQFFVVFKRGEIVETRKLCSFKSVCVCDGEDYVWLRKAFVSEHEQLGWVGTVDNKRVEAWRTPPNRKRLSGCQVGAVHEVVPNEAWGATKIFCDWGGVRIEWGTVQMVSWVVKFWRRKWSWCRCTIRLDFTCPINFDWNDCRLLPLILRLNGVELKKHKGSMASNISQPIFRLIK